MLQYGSFKKEQGPQDKIFARRETNSSHTTKHSTNSNLSVEQSDEMFIVNGRIHTIFDRGWGEKKASYNYQRNNMTLECERYVYSNISWACKFLYNLVFTFMGSQEMTYSSAIFSNKVIL